MIGWRPGESQPGRFADGPGGSCASGMGNRCRSDRRRRFQGGAPGPAANPSGAADSQRTATPVLAKTLVATVSSKRQTNSVCAPTSASAWANDRQRLRWPVPMVADASTRNATRRSETLTVSTIQRRKKHGRYATVGAEKAPPIRYRTSSCLPMALRGKISQRVWVRLFVEQRQGDSFIGNRIKKALPMGEGMF